MEFRLPLEGITLKFIFEDYSKICRKIRVLFKSEFKKMDISHEDLCTFMITSR